ncbi:unnamed protein product [Phytophthora fragariaefolia]|uniref:Unnamed protein product n=1 Tax=Phytophthora fragariaefolia TaxID=1490495 RepID=A0A9W7D3H0_9STRA|nr:unnamed protein product [Phytophthora fragariaefolia]
MENLVDHSELARQVDMWKDSGSSMGFMRYYKLPFSGAMASESGLCFLDAVRMALAYMGKLSLVALELWDAFEEQHSRNLEYVIRRGDAIAFYEYLQSLDIHLDYDLLFRKRLKDSIPDIECFEVFVRTLPLRVYVTCADRWLGWKYRIRCQTETLFRSEYETPGMYPSSTVTARNLNQATARKSKQGPLLATSTRNWDPTV